MTATDPDVKPPTRQFTDWLDKHPRTGWYIAAWALIVTTNQFVPFLDRLLP